MTLRCVAGSIHRPGEGLREGWLLHDGATVVDAGEGRPPQEPEARGTIIPAPVNAHTHVGDRVGRGTSLAGLSLAQVVAPPDGLKHRLLRETPPHRLVAGMREAVVELLSAGASSFVDFREGGVAGVEMLRAAAEGLHAEPVVLGRCAGAFDEDEAERVLAVADGYGLSAMADANDDAPERIARLCRRMGKRLALHLSEDRREDAQRALALRPDFLVHCVRATREDLRAIAAQRVPVVVCPRSNALFGPLPDVPAMLDEGVTLAIGSDNAMFHALDPMLDVRFLAERFPDVSRDAWLDALVAGGRVVAHGRAPRSWLRKGDPAGFRVLPATNR